MSIFSFFRKSKKLQKDKTNFNDYFTKELIWDILNSHSSTMMLFFSKKDGWIGANRLFLDTFGFKNIEEFVYKYDSVRELFLKESEEIFTEDDGSWLEYIRKFKQDGYHISVMTLKDEMLTINAKCTSLVKSKDFYILELENVTKLHLLELKIKEVEKLKSKFISNIEYEFRTPMNGIIGFVELLQHTKLDKNQNEYMEMINRSSKNLMSNIETLLDLSQMQDGKLNLIPSKFSLSTAMEKLLHQYYVIARNKGLNLFSFIDPKLPDELNSDHRKIIQIMNSLIQNAIKFTPKSGRVIVEVKLLKKRLNGDCSISFSVKDNSKGLTNEQIELITQPFNAGNHADEKLEVGLSLANGFVRILDSELKIQSEEGHGSYFNFILNFKDSKGQSYKMMPKKRVKILLLDSSRIDEANFLTIYLRAFAIDVVKSNLLDEKIYDGIETLFIIADQKNSAWMLKLGTYSKKIPIYMVLDENEKLETKLTHMVDGIFTRPFLPSLVANKLNKIYNKDLSAEIEKKSIIKENISALVVEDNLINQRLIKILLVEYRINVTTALNGNEAVSESEKQKFDIIFMDIDMSEKDGITATKEIKEHMKINAQTPIVALTAMAMQGDKERLLAEGLDDYMAKPLTRAKLENILNKYLKVVAV